MKNTTFTDAPSLSHASRTYGTPKRLAVCRRIGGTAGDQRQKTRQQVHSVPRGALALIRDLGFLRPGRARDVEVRPRGCANEFAEQRGGGNGRAVPPREVLVVGDVSLDHVRKGIVERELPHGLAGGAARREQEVDEALIVA